MKKVISLLDEDLVEGHHFSIMFYGGSLLTHLQISDDLDIDPLLQLLRLSQRAAIVMDSDRDDPSDSLKPAVARIVAECADRDILSWVTHGREIENYIDEDTWSSFIHDERAIEGARLLGRYDNIQEVLNSITDASGVRTIGYDKNKTTYAHKICSHLTIESLDGDMRETVQDLIERIRDWND